jgi:hypothetical protein
MNRFVAIFFLSTYLLTSTKMHEFLRIPLFIDHFIIHNKQDHLSLREFIVLHYFSGDVRDADWADDVKLPFKHRPEVTPTLWAFYLASPPSFVQPPKVIPVSSPKYNTCISSFFPSARIADIWQPPRA